MKYFFSFVQSGDVQSGKVNCCEKNNNPRAVLVVKKITSAVRFVVK